MSFDNSAFMRQTFEPRTAKISLPALAQWFTDEPDNPDKTIWTVRGQTASEMARAFESSGKVKNLDAIVKAIATNSKQVDELKSAIGINDDVPDDIIKRLEQLVACSVDPEIDMPLAVKLAETFPVEFYTLTNKIVELTGQGMDIPKSEASGTVLT